jgi:hypothetical protein
METETKTRVLWLALQIFLRATRSQARSSDQIRPTALASPLVMLLRISEPPYANSKTSLYESLWREHRVSGSQIRRLRERDLRSDLATL